MPRLTPTITNQANMHDFALWKIAVVPGASVKAQFKIQIGNFLDIKLQYQPIEVGKMIDSKMHRDSAVYDSESMQQRDIIVIILFFLGEQ